MNQIIEAQYEYKRNFLELPGYLLWKFIVMKLADSDLTQCSKIYDGIGFTGKVLLSIQAILIPAAVLLQLLRVVLLIAKVCWGEG